MGPPLLQGSSGLAHSTVGKCDHGGVGLYMCGTGALLIETGVWALSCLHSDCGKTNNFCGTVASYQCQAVSQNTLRMKQAITRKTEERTA